MRGLTDEEVRRMHYAQAEVLLMVPEADRGVVLDRAHFLQNVRGGILSGCLWSAEREYRAVGAEALLARTREENARLMAR